MSHSALCSDARWEQNLMVLDCCKQCADYPPCLYVDISELQCPNRGTPRTADQLPVEGCWDIETTVPTYPPGSGRPRVIDDERTLDTRHLPFNPNDPLFVIQGCVWIRQNLETYPNSGMLVEPITRICDEPKPFPESAYDYFFPLADIVVSNNAYSAPNMPAWKLTVRCWSQYSPYPGTIYRTLWEGRNDNYASGPVGTYQRIGGVDMLAALEVTECNQAP